MIRFIFVLFFIFVVHFADAVEDKIVAKVGDEIVLESELLKRAKLNKTATRSEVLDAIIEARVLVIKAKNDKIEIDEEFINNKIIELALDEPKSLDDFEKREQYKVSAQEEYLKSKIIDKYIKSKLAITDIDIEDFYQKHKDELPLKPESDEIGIIAKNIVPSKTTKDKIYLQMRQILDRINKGEDFSEIAKTESEDISAVDGGDMGFFGRGKFLEDFEEAAFSLAIGEVSSVVETDYGFHILKLLDKKDEEVRVLNILKYVAPSDEDIKDIKNQMEEVFVELNKGGDFLTIARKNSDQEIVSTLSQDTNYPAFAKSQLEALDYGGITDVIRQGGSFYIFSKIRKVEKRVYKLDEIKENLKQEITKIRQYQMYADYINQLKQEIYIKIY